MQQLNLILKLSITLSVLLIMLYVGAIVCVLVLPVYLWVKLLIIMLLCWRFVVSARRYIWRSGANAVMHVWIENDEWYLQNALGQTWRVSLRGDSLITRQLVILNFKLEDTKKVISVPIFFDSLSKGSMQELRRHLLTTRVTK